MAELQAYVCDAFNGTQVDRIPVSSFSYERLLSAAGNGSATIPLDGTFTKAELKSLTREWSRLIVLERDGVVEYIGYPVGVSYSRGASSVTLKLGDIWTMLGRRGAWDHSAPNVERWSTSVTGNLGWQGAMAILRGRTGAALPEQSFPVTLPGGYPGPDVTRTYYGYHLEYVSDVLSDLLAEGLDVYFRPGWITSGAVTWWYQAGLAWGSGVTHEFYVTAAESDVAGFSESSDAMRVTNNAVRIGEGSEVDMLARSNRNMLSPYPMLERVTMAKQVTDASQLVAMVNQDLVTFATPTVQWDFKVPAGLQVDVGDTVRLHFDGDPWVDDGWHTRRVVKVSGDASSLKTIGVQPTGGA